MLFKQIEDGTKYAALANVTIPDKEKIAIAYNLIHKTGELSTACKDWRCKPEDEKMWEAFKTHFTEEYLDYKEENSTITSS